jgi:hypothetical protein
LFVGLSVCFHIAVIGVSHTNCVGYAFAPKFIAAPGEKAAACTRVTHDCGTMK